MENENKITLFDTDKDMINAWRKEFKDVDDVKILRCSFKKIKNEYMVIPGNSCGIMYTELDLAVRAYYGIKMIDKIQYKIATWDHGKLDIGDSEVAYVEDGTDKPCLVYMPIMSSPINAPDTINIFYAFYNLLDKFKGDDIACCGLWVKTSRFNKKDCARIMRKAYDLWKEENSRY